MWLSFKSATWMGKVATQGESTMSTSSIIEQTKKGILGEGRKPLFKLNIIFPTIILFKTDYFPIFLSFLLSLLFKVLVVFFAAIFPVPKSKEIYQKQILWCKSVHFFFFHSFLARMQEADSMSRYFWWREFGEYLVEDYANIPPTTFRWSQRSPAIFCNILQYLVNI